MEAPLGTPATLVRGAIRCAATGQAAAEPIPAALAHGHRYNRAAGALRTHDTHTYTGCNSLTDPASTSMKVRPGANVLQRLLAPLGVPQLASSTDARPPPGWPPASRCVQDALAALPFSSRSSASSFFSWAICSSAVMPYFSSFCNLPRAVTRITSGVTIQQGVPRGLQGPLAGCGVSPPFSLTPPPEAVQEKGDLHSYHLEKWILKHVFMSQ